MQQLALHVQIEDVIKIMLVCVECELEQGFVLVGRVCVIRILQEFRKASRHHRSAIVSRTVCQNAGARHIDLVDDGTLCRCHSKDTGNFIW